MIYVVVTNHSVQDFVDEVNEWISKGFEPQGGATSVPVQGKGEHSLIQAMVKRD